MQHTFSLFDFPKLHVILQVLLSRLFKKLHMTMEFMTGVVCCELIRTVSWVREEEEEDVSQSKRRQLGCICHQKKKEKKRESDQSCTLLSLHQGADHSAGVEAAQVVVGLPCAHKHDGLARDVGHGNGSADLERKMGGISVTNVMKAQHKINLWVL